MFQYSRVRLHFRSARSFRYSVETPPTHQSRHNASGHNMWRAAGRGVARSDSSWGCHGECLFGLPRGNKSFALSVFTRGRLMSILPRRQRHRTLAWIGLECDRGDLVPPEKGEAATLANVSMSCLNDHRWVVTPTAWVTERIVKESESDHAWQATML